VGCQLCRPPCRHRLSTQPAQANRVIAHNRSQKEVYPFSLRVSHAESCCKPEGVAHTRPCRVPRLIQDIGSVVLLPVLPCD
jgi:hypothetical protein